MSFFSYCMLPTSVWDASKYLRAHFVIVYKKQHSAEALQKKEDFNKKIAFNYERN